MNKSKFKNTFRNNRPDTKKKGVPWYVAWREMRLAIPKKK